MCGKFTEKLGNGAWAKNIGSIVQAIEEFNTSDFQVKILLLQVISVVSATKYLCDRVRNVYSAVSRKAV